MKSGIAMLTLAVVAAAAAHAEVDRLGKVKRIVVHGVECASAEECKDARAVVDEAIRIMREDGGEFLVVAASPSLVRSRIVAAGIASERVRVRGSEAEQCLAALPSTACR